MDALATENADLRLNLEYWIREANRIAKPKSRTHAAKLSKETKAVLRELRKERVELVEAVWAISEALTGLGTRILDIEAGFYKEAGFNAHEAPSGPVEPGENDQG
jgi:hypothetical protein